MNEIERKKKIISTLKSTFKKVFLSILLINIVVLTLPKIDRSSYYVYADGEITDDNAGSIFKNLAFMIMGTLGIKYVASASGLGSGLSDSLGDLFNTWVSETNQSIGTITNMLNSSLSVKQQLGTSYLDVGGYLYNKITQFITWLNKRQTFTDNPADYPFTYDLHGTYVNSPFITYINTSGYTYGGYDLLGLMSALGYSSFYLSRKDYINSLNSIYYCTFSTDASSLNGFLYIVSSVALPSFAFFYDGLKNGTTTAPARTTRYNDILYYLYIMNIVVSSSNWSIKTSIPDFSLNNEKTFSLPLYYIFGAGAIGGYDGTIGLPDPITRNQDTPFPTIDDTDSFPLAVPDSFATDYPLVDTPDIPLSIPYAIPWVLDQPIDYPMDVPLDIPFTPFTGVPIPPATIPAPDPLVDVPMILTPECQGLSGCLLYGVETVSNQINSFIHLNDNYYRYIEVTVGIAFALLVMGAVI